MLGKYSTDSDIYDESHTWQYRVMKAAFPADPMGMVVKAVLGLNRAWGHAYGLSATIDANGVVRTSYREPHKPTEFNPNRFYTHKRWPIGSITDLRDEFRRLADHCKLNDKDRNALFLELKKWCGKDERAINNLDIPVDKRII